MESSFGKFYLADPVSKFFRRVLGLSPMGAVFVSLAVINIPIIAGSAYRHAFLNGSGRIGLGSDFGWWIFNVTGFPATLFAFFWLPKAIERVVLGLRKNRVLVIPESAEGQARLDTFLARFSSCYGSPFWLTACVLFAAAVLWFVWIPMGRNTVQPTWQTSSGFVFWYTEAAWFFLMLLGALVVIRGILTILWLNRLFKAFEVKVRILHPDKAGGLSPLGKFGVNIAYLLSIFAVSNVFANLSSARIENQDFARRILTEPVSVAIWGIYFVLAPLLFFLPLAVAHRAMRRAKSEYLEGLSDRYDHEIQKAQAALDDESHPLGESMMRIESVQKLHEIVSKFPIWPFNTSSLIRFFSAVLSPLALTVVSLLLEKILT